MQIWQNSKSITCIGSDMLLSLVDEKKSDRWVSWLNWGRTFLMCGPKEPQNIPKNLVVFWTNRVHVADAHVEIVGICTESRPASFGTSPGIPNPKTTYEKQVQLFSFFRKNASFCFDRPGGVFGQGICEKLENPVFTHICPSIERLASCIERLV